MPDLPLLRERYEVIRGRIASAAARAGRRPDEVTLIAVTKTWPVEVVLAAYEAGMRHFGENRPEELAQKRPVVEAALGDPTGIVWHLIGPMQSRKTHLAAAYADVFHALDREKIARRLSVELAESGRILPSFIEVNISGEASKFGLLVNRWEEDATHREKLRNMVITTDELAGLPVTGLMTMAPWDVEPEVIRSVFRRTRKLAGWLQSALGRDEAFCLSMGMTDDFEIAIEEGATHIRVGRALFGERTI